MSNIKVSLNCNSFNYLKFELNGTCNEKTPPILLLSSLHRIIIAPVKVHFNILSYNSYYTLSTLTLILII